MEEMNNLRAIEDRVGLVGPQTIDSFVIKRLFPPKVPPGALFRVILFVFNVLSFHFLLCGDIDNKFIVTKCPPGGVFGNEI